MVATLEMLSSAMDAEGATDIKYQQGNENPFAEKLASAMEWSRRSLRYHRMVRHAIVDQITGGNYSRLSSFSSRSTDDEEVPVNMLEMAKSTYARQMVASNPKALVSSPFRHLRPHAVEMMQAVNELFELIDFESTLYGLVDDSIVQLGVVKVGITDFDADGVYGTRHRAGQPYAETVDFDDWVMDMNAKRYEQVQYAGHRFRVPLQYVMDSSLYSNKENLVPSYYRRYNEEGDERVEVLSRGFEGDPEDLFDMVELWEVWIPWAKKIVTVVSDDSRTSEPRLIRSEPWLGPDHGPFHLLKYNDVPNNIMPVSPASLLMDLHLIGNRLFNKLSRQADRQKTILGAQGTAIDDAERVVKSNDGDTIRMENPDRAREFKFGGADESNLIFFTHVKELFNYYGGNLELLGGLGPAADTATQEKMLAAGAGKRMAHMQARHTSCTTKIIKDLIWWMWNDPNIDIPYTYRIPNTKYEHPERWTAANAKGEYLQYNFEVEPYSMAHRTPEMRAEQLIQLFERVIAPGIQLTPDSVEPDMEALLRQIGEYKNMHELERVLRFKTPNPDQNVVGSAPAHRMPANTSRTYNRVSTSRTTPGGKDQEMIQQLQKVKSQGSNGVSTPSNGAGRV